MTQATLETWKAYVEGGELPEGLREEVAQSWERCRNAGVDPQSPTLPQLPKADLEKRLGRSAELLGFLAPPLDALAKHLRDSGILIFLSDLGGCVLKVWGEAGGQDSELAAHLVPGLVLREVLCGSMASSLSRASNRAAVCEGREHYCAPLHDLVEAALPVRGESADRVGTLLLWGKAGTDSAASLLVLGRACLRQATLERTGRKLRETVWLNALQRHSYVLNRLMSTSSQPLLLVGPKGYLRAVSPAAVRLLQADLAQDLNRPLDQIARFDPPLLPFLKGGKDVREAAVDVHTATRSFRVTADAFSVRDSSSAFLGTMLQLTERAPIKTRRREAGWSARYTFQDILGDSESIRKCVEMGRIAAKTNVSVLVEGPSGTGKELFAQAIHNESDRHDGPFVSINCAAIPEELIESELFGYEEGAFTGARKGGMTGKFEAASGGTIFLDEIGDMPLSVQAECLRVLENRAVTRVGRHEEIPVDIRVIAATNKRLLDEVEAGRFREDLYYRLSVFRISLSGLRECASDIPGMVEHFLERYNHEMSRSVKGLADGVLDRFMTYEWPGNVRELKNALEHAVMVDRDGVLGFEDLPEELRDELLSQSAESVVDSTDPLLDHKKGIEKLRRDLEEEAKDLYVQALKETGGDVKKAAKSLSVSRATFYRNMKRFALSRAAVLRMLAETE